MIDYLDVYTRLCLHNYSDVLVAYYYSGGNKITKKAVLIEVVDFDYITIREENYFFNVHFFEKSNSSTRQYNAILLFCSITKSCRKFAVL